MAKDLDDKRQEKAARNQSLFRSVNERLKMLASEVETRHEFVCECVHTDCDERVELTIGEYESVRRIPTHFLVAPGHDVSGVDRVVEQTQRFEVVEKVGAGGSLAVELDPRRSSGPGLAT